MSYFQKHFQTACNDNTIFLFYFKLIPNPLVVVELVPLMWWGPSRRAPPWAMVHGPPGWRQGPGGGPQHLRGQEVTFLFKPFSLPDWWCSAVAVGNVGNWFRIGKSSIGFFYSFPSFSIPTSVGNLAMGPSCHLDPRGGSIGEGSLGRWGREDMVANETCNWLQLELEWWHMLCYVLI